MIVCPQSKRPFLGRKLMRGAMVVGVLLLPWLAMVGCSSAERPANSAGAGQGQGANEGLAGERGRDVGGEGGRASGGEASGGEPSNGIAGHDASGGEHSGPGVAGAAGDAAGGAPPGPFAGPDPFPCDSDADVARPVFAAVCSPQVEWLPAVAAPITVGPNASLLGITPDELTIVWLEPESSQVVYFVADRSSADGAFGQAQRLEGEDVLAVSPDGLRLVVLSDDQGALLERTRAGRGQPFGDLGEGDFVLLNADAQLMGHGFSSCVFAPDGLGLFYTVDGAAERHPLRESRRSAGAAWPLGVALQACELEAHAGFGRYPSGVSSDGKTLFFYDAWRGVARGAWRETTDGPFTWFQNLGDWRAVQVNAACDGLYYSAGRGAAPIVVSRASRR